VLLVGMPQLLLLPWHVLVVLLWRMLVVQL
jgi:hypothetical protein